MQSLGVKTSHPAESLGSMSAKPKRIGGSGECWMKAPWGPRIRLEPGRASVCRGNSPSRAEQLSANSVQAQALHVTMETGAHGGRLGVWDGEVGGGRDGATEMGHLVGACHLHHGERG